MLEFPRIDPVAISLGPVQIHWYALTYIAGFAMAWFLGCKRADQKGSGWTRAQVTDLVTNSAIGVILGGRLGYMFFYNFGNLVENPASLIRIWEGGMSFHGGFIGVGVAVWLFARSTKKTLFQVADFTAPLAPLGLAFGRLGNFINAELWGRAADVPWAMVFPGDLERVARHPSQLYQFALEGVCLFAILLWYSSRPRPTFAVTGAFCLGYGVFRTFAEFFREPDAHLGYVALDWVTRGQQLSIPMVIVGLVILYGAYMQDWFESGTRNKGQGTRA
jgi:phosphatidylglycerol:prolipoprotein diacylglycerol transferase